MHTLTIHLTPELQNHLNNIKLTHPQLNDEKLIHIAIQNLSSFKIPPHPSASNNKLETKLKNMDQIISNLWPNQKPNTTPTNEEIDATLYS